MSDKRQHVHELIDQLPPVQVDALEILLQSMLDPLSRKLASAPFDDEPFTEEDRLAIAEADEWLKRNEPVALETVLADFGLTQTDWDKMAKAPLPDDNGSRNG